MGVLTRTNRAVSTAALNLVAGRSFAPVSAWQDGQAQLPDSRYVTYAQEGYMKNELVFACIEELATSAAEPSESMQALVGGEWKRDGQPILDLLHRPNEFMDAFQFWATVMMHRALAGNAFALIVRTRSMKPAELWLLRPDQVSIVPDRETYIRRYEYDLGDGTKIPIPPEDIIHIKTRHPLDQFYGMPPLMAASGRTDIDNYMKDFVKQFFMNAGVPAGVLAVKGSLDQNKVDEIRSRFRANHGTGRWHELLVTTEGTTFTPTTMALGAQGLVVPDLDGISEARIAMVFQVPLSLVGARLGMSSSSYGNREADRAMFWHETLAPIYRELAAPLNLRLVPSYSQVKAVKFDLSGISALQEDIDKRHERWRKDLNAGGITIEEFRAATGRAVAVTEGTYLVPSNLVAVPAADVAAGKVTTQPPKAPVTAPEEPAGVA